MATVDPNNHQGPNNHSPAGTARYMHLIPAEKCNVCDFIVPTTAKLRNRVLFTSHLPIRTLSSRVWFLDLDPIISRTDSSLIQRSVRTIITRRRLNQSCQVWLQTRNETWCAARIDMLKKKKEHNKKAIQSMAAPVCTESIVPPSSYNWLAIELCY